MTPRRLLAALTLTAVLAGCGLSPHSGTRGVTIMITRDFGARVLRVVHVGAGDRALTALQLLEREVRVRAAAGARVTAIGGVLAAPGQRWSHYVNGIGQPDITARQAALQLPQPVVHAGDTVWWDLHDDGAAPFVGAVVGAFPEPFRRGILGRRFPSTLECAPDVAVACRRVSAALGAAGVAAPTQELGTGSGQDSIGVLVGTWRDLRGTLLATLLDAGPSASGIYAHFTPDGAHLQLLDAGGGVRATLGAGAGLLAAARDNSPAPTWLVTGTDLRGVQAAAGALSPGTLRDRYAVAISAGRVQALPAP